MAALFQTLKSMLPRENGKHATNGATLENAYSALNINAARRRNCQLLEEKVGRTETLSLPEARYYHQHCNKTRNEVNAVMDPMYRVSPTTPKRIRNFMNMVFNKEKSPIPSGRYPMGGKHKTRKSKRSHSKKRKHTRKH